jgi:hypothetical protein
MVMKTTDLLVRIFDILTISLGLRTVGGNVVVVVVVVVDSTVVDVGRESDGMGSSALTLFDNPICIASTEVNAIQAMFKDFLTFGRYTLLA